MRDSWFFRVSVNKDSPIEGLPFTLDTDSMKSIVPEFVDKYPKKRNVELIFEPLSYEEGPWDYNIYNDVI